MARDSEHWSRRPTTRRGYLRTTGAATAVALAGCVGGRDGGGDDGGSGGSGSGGGNGGASTGTPAPEAGGTIRYLTDRGDSKEVLEAIVADFEAEFPSYTVEVTFTSKGTSTDQEMQQMVAGGTPPDVFFDTSADAYRFQRDGVLAPVTDTVADNDLPDPVNVGGESYFAASMVEPLMGWYRNDLYPEDPTTWDGWLAEAARVTEEEGIDGYVVQSGQTNNADTQVTQYLWQNDVDVYAGPSDAIEVVVDQGANRDRAVETFQWIADMAEYSPNGSGWEWGDMAGALMQENAAAGVSVGGLPMLIMGANRPEFTENFSAMPFPVPEGRQQDKWWAYMEGHLVRNDGESTEGAREFVTFFNQSERFFDFILSAPLFQFPPSLEQLRSDRVQDNEQLQQFPGILELVEGHWDVFTSVLATGDDGAPNLTAARAYGNQVFGQAADQLLVGGRSPAETVDWLADALRSIEG